MKVYYANTENNYLVPTVWTHYFKFLSWHTISWYYGTGTPLHVVMAHSLRHG